MSLGARCATRRAKNKYCELQNTSLFSRMLLCVPKRDFLIIEPKIFGNVSMENI